MIKQNGITLFLVFLSFTCFSQFYVKGGLLINQQNKKLIDLNLYQDRSSFVLGIGQEMKLLKILRLDAGVQLMNFNIEDTGSGVISNNISIGLPVQAKIRPVSLFDLGAGIMPMVNLSDENPIFEKKAEIGGMFSLGINLSKSFILEASYNFGLIENGISILDVNGNLLNEVNDRFQFYTLGLRVKF